MTQLLTQFGFEKVTPQEKAERVNAVFSNVSSIYDHMNDLMSFGLHRQWKNHAVTALSINPTNTVADIACGSGDISIRINRRLTNGTLLCIDPNQEMLEQCRQRLSHFSNVTFVESSAEQLSLPFLLDRAIISFGLRNFTDPELGLSKIFEHLKPGGKLVIMEFNPPEATCFQRSYPHYLHQFLPFLGEYIAKDAASYQYLADSICTQPTPEQRKVMLSDLGYQSIIYSSINFGIIGLFEAYRI